MHANDANYEKRAHDQLVNVYLSEMQPLHKISQDVNFADLIEDFSDYPAYLERCRDNDNILEQGTDSARIISASDSSYTYRSLFHHAHVAGCCVLLRNQTLPKSDFTLGKVLDNARTFINSRESWDTSVAQPILQACNNLDAVRTMHLLRSAGLVTRDSSEFRQLGLGAAGGLKDIYFLHATPVVSIVQSSLGTDYHFDYEPGSPADIVISDSDPRFAETYENYEKNQQISVSGFIDDTMSLLSRLPELTDEKRNLVTMLRIEPAMIPDATGLLARLSAVIDDDCDFIFSIGAGDSEQAYQNRIDVTAEIFDILDRLGLCPVLFKLHLGGTAYEQASSLQYGSAAASSFEILYCKLDPTSLKELC